MLQHVRAIRHNSTEVRQLLVAGSTAKTCGHAINTVTNLTSGQHEPPHRLFRMDKYSSDDVSDTAFKASVYF
jgi:hypothetical protein